MTYPRTPTCLLPVCAGDVWLAAALQRLLDRCVAVKEAHHGALAQLSPMRLKLLCGHVVGGTCATWSKSRSGEAQINVRSVLRCVPYLIDVCTAYAPVCPSALALSSTGVCPITVSESDVWLLKSF
jgi:hypothetical protein